MPHAIDCLIVPVDGVVGAASLVVGLRPRWKSDGLSRPRFAEPDAVMIVHGDPGMPSRVKEMAGDGRAIVAVRKDDSDG